MDSSSENMDSNGEEYGTLLFFRKDGAQSLPYPLNEGQNTVGSSSEADVRLKINDHCLEKIHCVVDVNENGIATIINKSEKAPIKVNGILIRKCKVLNDKDIIDIVGKKCQYLNENISDEEMKKNEEALAKKALILSSNRRTITPMIQGKSSAKKMPNLRIKTPLQKMPLKRKSEGVGVEHISSVTPEKRLDKRWLSEKSKTTSKLVVSKALGTKTSTAKRRLSLESGPRRPNNNVNGRVSARNIQFNKNTVTSMITEDEERPSLSMKQISTPVNKKLESVKSSSRRSIRKSLTSGNDLTSFDSPRKSILKNTPRKSVISLEDNTSDLLTKTVSFLNVKIPKNDKDDEKSITRRNSGNRSGILYSDETENLRLSSLSSLSPLGSYPSQDSLFSSSDTESPKKSISRLSLRKSMENQIERPPSRKSRLSLAKTSFNIIENPGNSINAPKTRISPRNSITIPDEINKTDSSDESMNLHLSASSTSFETYSTKDIKDVYVTSMNIPTLKQRDSMLDRVSTDELCGVSSRIESQDSEVSSSKSSPERNISTPSCDDVEKVDSVDKVNEKHEILTRKSSLRRNDTLNDSLEEDIALVGKLSLSPVHLAPRRSSTRKSGNDKVTYETTEYNLQASVRKSNESIEQDEENESLNISEDYQYSKSELESSFEESTKGERSLTTEKLPSSSSRRSSVGKSHTTETLVSTRRSSLKIPDDFSSQGNRVSETTRTSLRKSNTSLVDNVDELGAKGKKCSVLTSPSSEKNRSSRDGRNSSTSRNQNTSVLSLNNKTPETNRRPSLRNSSRRSLVENFDNESQTSFVENRKSFFDSSQENLTPELETTSSVKTPQPKRNSSIKHGDSLDNDVQENLTSSLGNTSEIDNRSIKNRKSSLGRQQDLTLPLAGTTPVPRNRSSVRGRKSLDDDIQGDLTLAVDHEMQNQENGSSRKSRKSSLGNLRQDKTLPLEGKTPVPRSRSSVKSRKSQVNDLQEDLTMPMNYEMPELHDESSRKSSIYDLHEKSTLPMEDDTPNSKIESSRRSRKSSLGALQEDSFILSEGQSPVPRNRSSLKSRKSSVNEDSTLPMNDETPNSKIESSRTSRKSSLGNLEQGSAVLLDGQSPLPRNRSSVKSRKSSVNDLHEDSTLPMEDETTDSENESFKKSRKSALYSLHHDSTLRLETQTPIPRNRSSIKSRKSSVNDLLEDSTLPLERQTPIPRNRSSVKHSKSSVNGLHENSTLPLEFQQELVVTLDNKTPELSRSSVKIKNSSIHHFSEGKSLLSNDGKPQPIRRSTRTPKPSLRYSTASIDRSLASQSDASVVCLETSTSSLTSKPFSVSDNEESLPTPEKSSGEKFQVSSVDRLSSIGHPLQNSTSINAKTPLPYRRYVRRSSKLEESYTISVAHSTLHEGHSSLYENFSIEDSRAETPESSRRSSARRYTSENFIDSDTPDDSQDPSESWTPGADIRSSRRTNKSTDDLYRNESRSSMRSETPEDNQVYSVGSSTMKERVSVGDTLDGTPENNTSIVFIDSPMDESRQPGHLRLSKTIRSKIEEVDLTTPKSAIKSRRRKSLPYRPETEDITPVSPLDQNESETGFKTPLTTPGLFEDIRKSVLKSRSRMQKSSSSFMEELSKAKSDKKTSKRPRESTGDSGRQHKRRKIVINEDDSFESFESFQSDEALTDISASNLSQDVPSHFSDLTDKPVITHPRTRFSTGDKPNKRQSTRRSLPVSTMMVHTSDSNSADEENSEEYLNELSEEVKWVQKSPENDLTNVAGVKKLMKTLRVQNSPKNDISDVRGIKKLLSTPRVVKSPKNDLTNIVGVKKLLTTPKEMKSPKNDLTNIPNLRRIMSPKYQNSPVNDLSDLRGVKKLLGTPKKSKDPLNELSDLEGVAEIFNISGVHRLSNTSDIENNEDMFGQLIVRRPLKTYRGKSLSPKKAIDSYGAKRKTMGDKSVVSPRVEDWLKEQAVIKIKRLVDLGTGDAMNEVDAEKNVEKLSTRSKKTRVQEIKEEIPIASPPRRGARRKAAAQNKVGASTPTESSVRKATRGKSKKVKEEIGVQNESKETEFTKEVESLTVSEPMEENSVEPPRTTRGRRKAVVLEEKPTRGRKKAANQFENPKETEEVEKPITAKTAREKKKNIDEEKSEDLVVASVESPKVTRGRRKVKEYPVVERTRVTRKLVDEKSEENDDENVSEKSEDLVVASVESPKITRGRRKVKISPVVEKTIKLVDEKSEENDADTNASSTPKPVRGKRKVIVDEKSKETDVVFVDSPKIQTRGRRNAKVVEEVIVEKPTRGRRKVGGKGKIIEESSDDALCESSEIIEFKKPVSRKNTKDTDTSDENEFSVGEEADTYEVAKKNTRGTKKVQKMQDVFVDSSKMTRGKKKVVEVVKSTVDESEESTKSTRKGRNVRTAQAEDSKKLTVSITDIKKPTSKSSKVTKIEDEISSAQVDSTTGDFSPDQSEDSDEENISKPIKGKRTRRNVEIEADIKLDKKPELRRTKRGRKVSDEALTAMETRTESEEVENKKISKPKAKKITKKDLVEDIESSRPTRTGRHKENEDVSSATAKKQTGGKKLAEEENVEIVKVTRGRRRKESEDITEEPAKKITKTNEKEEASIGNTRKAGRLAKNKAVAKITEEEVSSPKTRSVKGNFNKYGSSFETESPGKAVGRRKRVHFD